MLKRLLTLAALAVFAEAALDTSSVEEAVKDAKIVPDVLSSFSPIGLLSVVYNGSVDVEPGHNLSIQQVTMPPQVSLASDNANLANGTFVLCMVDPDAPTPQNRTFGQIRHMVASDLTLNGSLADGAKLVNNTPALSEYIKPNPPSGSDPHRYILLLFNQPDSFASSVGAFLNDSVPIFGFNVSTFATELGLGEPIAANFFVAGPIANTSSTNTSGTAAASTTSPSSAFPNVRMSWMGAATALALLGATLF